MLIEKSGGSGARRSEAGRRRFSRQDEWPKKSREPIINLNFVLMPYS
jgi:hypothetical protein